MTENFTGDAPKEILNTQLEEKDYQRYETSFNEYLSVLPTLISEGLEKKDSAIRDIAVELIQYVPENQRGPLIKKGLGNNDNDLLNNSPQMIRYAPKDSTPRLIRKGLKNPDPDVRETSAKMIQYTLKNKIPSLIRKGLRDSFFWVKEAAVQTIPYAPKIERAILINIGLEDDEPSVRSRTAEMIPYASTDKIAILIKKGLEDSHCQVRATAVRMTPFADRNTRAYLVNRGLNDEYSRVRDATVEMIQSVPADQIADLIKNGHRFLEAIQFTHKMLTPEDKHILEEIADHPNLYSGYKQGSLKQDLKKTGSETTLLLSFDLKNKAIIRIINPCALFPWKKAFENNAYWESKGFNYIPVEPIIGVRLGQSIEKVSIMTRVIPGPTIWRWKQETALWTTEIEEQKKKIVEGLKELNIRHGHLHNHNFVLYFQRKKDGKPDISRPPQVYVIDFDQSESSEAVFS